jgi:hypothetical protein
VETEGVVRMQTLEEYIAKRKIEDGLNEFDTSQKMNNIRTCIDYIFEYFDQYLPIQGAEKRTVLENEKLLKYEKTLSEFSPDVRDWLVSIYDTYGKQLNRNISNFVDNDDIFPFMYEEAEFRSLSYDCYAALIKKCPFIKNQAEFLYKFIREYHIKECNAFAKNMPEISDKITKWMKDTLVKYGVNIASACEGYVSYFWDNPDMWPARSKIKLEHPFADRKYRYDHKRKTNVFNIDGFYNRFANKPFIKGKKKQLEILMMYYWLHSIEGDDDDYWNEYLLQCEDY